MSEKIGLFIDKFSILHRGHQLCIKYALHEVDRLIIAIYDSPNESIPLPVRTNWLKKMYPNVEIIQTWNNLEELDSATAIENQKQFLTEKLSGEKITHFYSTQSSVESLCRGLNCENRLIPSIRNKMCNATREVQSDNYRNIARIDPVVYKDLITNIAFVGAQSTGKSTITEAMAKEYNTNWMHEYGRYYCDVYQVNNRVTLDEIEIVTERHLQMEEELLKTANKYLFTDTCPIVTYRYAHDWYGTATDRLIELAQEAETRYDIFFLCGDDIPYADTPERDGAEQRRIFQSQIKSELLMRKIPYIELRGTLEQRMDKAKRVLHDYEKYTSLGRNIGTLQEHQQIFPETR